MPERKERRISVDAVFKKLSAKFFEPGRKKWRNWEATKLVVDAEREERRIQQRYQERGTKSVGGEYMLCNVPDEFRESSCLCSQPDLLTYGPCSDVLLVEPASEVALAELSTRSPYLKQNDYPGGTFHQTQSQLNLVANYVAPLRYGEPSLSSHSASNLGLVSNHRPATLQPVPSSIPTLHHTSDVRSVFAVPGQFDSISPSIASSHFVFSNVHDHKQQKQKDQHDSAHSSSSSSAPDSADLGILESQQNDSLPPGETSVDPPLADEPAAMEREERDGQAFERDIEIVAGVPRSLSRSGVRRRGSRGGIKPLPSVPGPKRPLQSSQPSPLWRVTNPTVQEDIEESQRTETPTIEQQGAPFSQSSSQADLPTPTISRKSSSNRAQAATATPLQYCQQPSSEAHGFYNLPENLVQEIGDNHRHNEFYLQQDCERRAVMELKWRRSLGAYRHPPQSMKSLHDPSERLFGLHRQSTQSLTAHRASRSSVTLPNQWMEQGRSALPFALHQSVRRIPSTQIPCSIRTTPVGDAVLDDAHATHSTVEMPRMRGSQTPVHARSISSKSRVSASDHASTRSDHSKTPSATSTYYGAQRPQSISPSPQYFRYPDGPINTQSINGASRVAVKGHSSGVNPQSRTFSGFSGTHLHIHQRPYSMMHPAGYGSEAEYLRTSASPQPQFNALVYPPYGVPRVQSTPSLPTSSRPHSARSEPQYRPLLPLIHQRSMGYLPPGGPLIRDAMTLSPPARGKTRIPKEIPRSECAPNVNIMTSYDKNGEHIGFHYVDPTVKQWNEAVHAVEKFKRYKEQMGGSQVGGHSNRPRMRERKRAFALCKSPQPEMILEEGELPHGRGLYGLLERNERKISMNRRGKVSIASLMIVKKSGTDHLDSADASQQRHKLAKTVRTAEN